MRLAAFCAGLAAGIKVTRDLHGDPDAGRWGERLGRTRLRYANLPVGGALAVALSTVLPHGVAAPCAPSGRSAGGRGRLGRSRSAAARRCGVTGGRAGDTVTSTVRTEEGLIVEHRGLTETVV